MEVNSATLRGLEAGRRGPGGPMLDALKRTLGISADFLFGEKPSDGFEEEVEHLARLLVKVPLGVLSTADKLKLGERLRDLREKAGYPSATAAAAALGLNRASYVAYEGRGNAMSLERALMFAFELGGNATDFLQGVDGGVNDNADPDAKDDIEFDAEWTWSRSDDFSVKFSVIEKRAKELRLSQASLMLPLSLLKIPVNRLERSFALVLDGGSEIAIVGRSAKERGATLVFDGRAIRERQGEEPVRSGDPLNGPTGGVPIFLGVVLRRMALLS
jgi:transcriptional regulator with XRE-family HTH domain